jgi:DegV family protein with EDD domain
MPPELRERYGVEVVPMTVVVDGVSYQEGIDLDADAFYARFAGGATPAVSTAAPAVGAFMTAYERLARQGATEVLSVHIGSSMSATVSSARLAAAESPVPVRIVDSGTASFGVACCVWEAAEAIAGGAGVEEAAAVAQQVAETVVMAFVIGALDLARAGGRLGGGGGLPDGIPVHTLTGGKMEPIGSAHTVEEAAEAMAGFVRRAGTNLRVGISIADAGAAPMWHALEERLSGAPEVIEVVRYRVGPSVGAHSGPGTAGAVAYPAMVVGRP